MVLLGYRDAALVRPGGKGSALVGLEAAESGLLAAERHPFQHRHPLPPDAAGDASGASRKGSAGGPGESPLIVSSPLLPIRQSRRAHNPNRNYRIVGTTQSAPAPAPGAPLPSHEHAEMVAAVTTPPTPVSGLASTASSAASVGSAVSRSSSANNDPGAGADYSGRCSHDGRSSRSPETAVEPIVVSGPHTVLSYSASHRLSRMHGQPHVAEQPDGRAARVGTLFPGARATPGLPGDAAAAAESRTVAQHYLVQRAAGRAPLDHDPHQAELASHPASQIRIASPQMRLHDRQRASLTQSLDTLDERPAPTINSTHQAGADHAAARNAARQSWNTGTGDDDDSDPGARIASRQPKRRAVRALVTTERFFVRPVSILGGAFPESADSPASPVQAIMSALSVCSEHANASYAASSADEHAGHPGHRRSRKQRHPLAHGTGARPRLAEQQWLEQRATSFDLGRIGHATTIRDRASGATQRSLLRGAGTKGSVSSLRFGADSNHKIRANRPGPPRRAVDVRADAVEDGYYGDSEGLAGAGTPVPVHRRNTVAGDLVSDSPGGKWRAARLQTPRNTSDYAEFGRGKDERRLARGSRRRSTTQSLLTIGTLISPGHANYVLMYNMLTGIRVSVSRCEAKDARPVRADDYDAQHKYSFDVVGDEMTPSSRYDFKFKDYAPWVFRCIREAFHLSTEEYLVSLTDKYILSEVGSSGKSGSFFYYSQDYRFIIKTVHHTEHKFMRQILPQYYGFARDNPHTLLSRIYGLHRIKLPHGRKVHFIVMSNILPPNKDIHAQFDLKGSLQGRELSAELASKPRACMKDRNWVNLRHRLHLGPTKRHLFVKQLISDVTLLIKLNIMDYSLLIGIHDLNKGNAAKLRDTTLAMFDPQTTDIHQLNRLTRAHTIRKKVVHTDPVALDALPQGTLPPLPESMFQELRHSMFYREDGGILSTDKDDCPAQLIYYLGVIDILTPYNALKRAEHVVKSVVHDGSQISAVNPRKYGLRFLNFMIRSLDGCEDVLPLLEEFERTTFQDICRQHRPF